MEFSRIRPSWRKSSPGIDNSSCVGVSSPSEGNPEVTNPEHLYDEIPQFTEGERRTYLFRGKVEDPGGRLRSRDKLKWEAIQTWGKTIRYCLIVVVTTASAALLLWLSMRG